MAYMICKLQNKNPGFNLPEVLITLLIIAFVSVIIVPSMNNNTSKKELVVKLKKAESVLGQALRRMNFNNGYPPGDYYVYRDKLDFMDEFAKAVSVNKRCNSADGLSDACFGNFADYYTKLNGEGGFNPVLGKTVVTADGIMYNYHVHQGEPVYGLSEEDASAVIGRIMVDVNGQKKPNRAGRDVFFFYLAEGQGILPAGKYVNDDCKSRTQNGFSCAARVLKEDSMDY